MERPHSIALQPVVEHSVVIADNSTIIKFYEVLFVSKINKERCTSYFHFLE